MKSPGFSVGSLASRMAAANAFALLIWTGVGISAADAGLITHAQRLRLAPLLSQAPMEVYLATGPEDACGKGCNEWIAVQGRLDPGAAQRFKEFLNSESRRRLPVFFHSPGGTLAESVEIGRLLRTYRMTASVGRTTPTGCREEGRGRAACDRRKRAGTQVSSRLQFADAQCHSACVYALIGASRRTIAPGSLVGIHAPRTDMSRLKEYLRKNPAIKVMTPADTLEYTRRYMSLMGVDPQLANLSATVSNKTIYILNRDEITRYRIELPFDVVKKWDVPTLPASPRTLEVPHYFGKKWQAAALNNTGRSTIYLEFTCTGSAVYGLTLFYPLPAEGRWPTFEGYLKAGETTLVLPSGAGRPDGPAIWSTQARTEQLRQIANESVAEFAIVGNESGNPARFTLLSTTGMKEALSEMRKNCGPEKDTSVRNHHSPLG